MKVIDVHVHIFPDSLAERAVSHLSETSGVEPVLDGTAADLIKSMKKAGVVKSVTAPIATKPDQVKSINNYSASQDREFFIPLGSIHPDFDDIEKEADRIVSMKLAGIKLHSNYQEFLPDDGRMFPIYNAMEKRGLVILFHCGMDLSFDDDMAPPRNLSIVLEKFPKLKVIGAHFGGWRVWDEVEKYLIGKNIYLDTSYTVPDITPERLKKLIKEHNVEKVLFGTDSPWKDQTDEIKMIKSLGFSESEENKIFYNNAKKLFPDFL